MKYKKVFNSKDQYKIAITLKKRKRKSEANKSNPLINKAVWNAKRKKRVYPFTQNRFIQPTVPEILTDVKEETCDTTDFKSASKFVSRCLEKLDRGELMLKRMVDQINTEYLGLVNQSMQLK